MNDPNSSKAQTSGPTVPDKVVPQISMYLRLVKRPYSEGTVPVIWRLAWTSKLLRFARRLHGVGKVPVREVHESSRSTSISNCPNSVDKGPSILMSRLRFEDLKIRQATELCGKCPVEVR